MITDNELPSTAYANAKGKNVVFFDGYCNLCNGSVNFISKRNGKKQLAFASLQSVSAKNILGVDFNKKWEPDSIVFLEKGKIYEKSTAVIRLCRYLNQPYPILQVLIFIPRFIRDGVYRWVAKNRYKWFGKRDSCRIAIDSERDMFLD